MNLGSVRGSGEKGRILLDDVKAFVKLVMSGGVALARAAPALPKAHNYDPSAFGAVEVKPLNRVQKISGPRLQAAWINIPHVTQFDESDITDLEALRGSLKDKAAAAGRQGDAAGVHHPGRGARDARIPGAQQPARRGRPEPASSRSSSTSASRPTRPMACWCRSSRAPTSWTCSPSPRRSATSAARRARANYPAPTCRARASRSRASAASAARCSRPSSIRPKSPSSACRSRR